MNNFCNFAEVMDNMRTGKFDLDKGMRIGMDAKRAFRNYTGLGNYSRLVVEKLARDRGDWDFVLYTPEGRVNERIRPILELPNVSVSTPRRGPGAFWRSWGITKQLVTEGIDLYHGLSNELPLNIRGRVPTVVTIHDVIYRRMPECYSAIDRRIYDFKYGRSVRLADRVIAVSERTKADVVDLYGVSPEKIDVVYQGCDKSFKRRWTEEEVEGLRKRLNLPDRYIVQVGTIEQRKNLKLTVRALAGLSDKEICLVAVGRDRLGYRKEVERLAEELGVRGRLKVLESLAFADLPGVCQGAAAVCYPSFYEGFGIPVLEGLESGRPVIAATGSCLEEAGGHGAYYVNPRSAKEMAAALESALGGGAEVASRIKEGLRHASRFGAGTMTEGLLRSYERAIESFHK